MSMQIAPKPLSENATREARARWNNVAKLLHSMGAFEDMLVKIQRLLNVCAHAVIVTNDVFSDGVNYEDGNDAYLRALAREHRAGAVRHRCTVRKRDPRGVRHGHAHKIEI